MKYMQKYIRYIALVLCLCAMFAVSGCGSSGYTNKAAAVPESVGASWDYENDAYRYAEEVYASEEAKATGVSTSGISSSVVQEIKDTKLVYTAYVSSESKKFEDDTKAIADLISNYGGYISDSSFSDSTSWRYGQSYGYRTQQLTIRIPTESYTDFMDSVRSIGHVTSTSDSVEDITRNYYSTKTTLDSLRAQRKFLLDMYDQAETIEDMLEIRDRLVDVEEEIKWNTIRINTMDDEVAFSTIHFTLIEVVEYSDTSREVEERTFGEKLIMALQEDWTSFVAFVLGIVLFVARNLWWLLLVACIVIIIVCLVKRHHRKKVEIKEVAVKNVKNSGNADKPAEHPEEK